MEKLGGSPRQWPERFLRDRHLSATDRAVHQLRCLCDVLEEAACFGQLNLGALACLEVAARRLNLTVWTPTSRGAHSHVNAKYLTHLGESDKILAPGLQAHTFWRAREDWEVMQSTKKADAAAAVMDFTVQEDEGGNDGKQGGGASKGQCRRGRGSRRIGGPVAEK